MIATRRAKRDWQPVKRVDKKHVKRLFDVLLDPERLKNLSFNYGCKKPDCYYCKIMRINYICKKPDCYYCENES